MTEASLQEQHRTHASEGDGGSADPPRPRVTRRNPSAGVVLAIIALVAVLTASLAWFVGQAPDEVGTNPRVPAPPSERGVEVPDAAATPFAGPGTTGHEADIPGVHRPARLERHAGDYQTSRDGEVVSKLDIGGVLRVRHAGVIVEDVRAVAVDVDIERHPDASVDIRWSTIGDPLGWDGAHNAIGRGNFRVFRSQVFGAVDLVKIQGGEAVVEQSWLHSGYQWASDPGQDGDRSHVDFVQTTLERDVTRIVLTENTFDVWVFGPRQTPADVWGDASASLTATGAVSLFQHENEHRIRSADVTKNVFRGDVYSWFYVLHDSDDPPPDRVVIADNVIDVAGAQRAVLTADTPSALTWEGNVDVEGEEVRPT